MSKVSSLLFPIVLLVIIYAFLILSEGGVRKWVARWKRKAEAQGGSHWVLVRILITIAIITAVMAVIQMFSK